MRGSKKRYPIGLQSMKQKQDGILMSYVPQDSHLLMLKVASAFRSSQSFRKLTLKIERRKAVAANHRSGIDVTVCRGPEQGMLKREREGGLCPRGYSLCERLCLYPTYFYLTELGGCHIKTFSDTVPGHELPRWSWKASGPFTGTSLLRCRCLLMR